MRNCKKTNLENTTQVFEGTAMGEKCPNTEFFWSVFSRIYTENGKIRIRKNPVFGQFSQLFGVKITEDGKRHLGEH